MHLKLTLNRGDISDDILVTVDTTAKVGDVAEAIALADPREHLLAGESNVSLRIDFPGEPRVVPASLEIADAGVQSGQIVSVVSTEGGLTSTSAPVASAATLQVIEGPDAGSQFPLAAGSNQLGRSRSSDVRLTDRMVSNRHVRINVTDYVEVIDLNSANGTHVAGVPVERVQLVAGQTVRIGETIFRVTHHQGAAATEGTSPIVEFNRSPRLDPEYEGQEFIAPEPPSAVQSRRFPLIPLLAPVAMGMVLFLVTRNLLSIMFIALSPLMIIGSFFESRVSGKKAFQEGRERFRAGLKDLAIQLNHAAEQEGIARRSEAPSTKDVFAAARSRDTLLWARRPDRRAFGSVRLGLGTLPARNSVKMPQTKDTTPELWRELEVTRDEYALVDNVPVAPDLRETGTLGFAGSRDTTLGLVRSAVAQIVGLHSPAQVLLFSLASPESSRDWLWLRWLPHCSSDHSPLDMPQLASDQADVNRLVAALEELISIRTGDRDDESRPMPALVVLVADDTPVERSRLVELAERGRAAGVYVVWYAPTVSRLPAACRVYVDNTNSAGVLVGFTEVGRAVVPVSADRMTAEEAERMARALSALKDSGARVHDDTDLPRVVSFLDLVGSDTASTPESVVNSWYQSGSLPGAPPLPKQLRQKPSLRALVGLSSSDIVALDLRSHGPHALVGGTTGSGKSEFLQSWVMGMAVAHSPARVTFLFVDYKGGSAFGECVKLPHTVGLVTDLNTHLVRRVLTSLKAELRHREHILNDKKAKDLLELERRGDPDAPPSLVIVVDEFAALAGEIPEFVDGVIDVAQRGRSLGLHLILATQRPSGVIKGSLRANTNLRVALRMADEDDSNDVVGSTQAAMFDPSMPGRAIAKLGPGRLTAFQSAYVGGWTTDEPTKASVDIADLWFGPGAPWEPPSDDVEVREQDRGPTDLARLATNVRKAAAAANIAKPRIPWQPELQPVYDLSKFHQSRTDTELVFGLLDEPARQVQRPVAFFPDQEGNMAIFGTGGTGKSTVLKTLGIVAGLTMRGGPCHVYALDFGSRSLDVLSRLPHVGSIINGADEERVARLIRWLVQEIDRRAEAYGESGTIVDYRRQANKPDEPRILVLVDNFGAFRQAYEVSSQVAVFEGFQRVVGEGRQVGIHVVLTADRSAAVPSSVSSSIQQRLVLRAAEENDYTFLGVPTDVLTASSPPGRGLMGDHEVQVALLGGNPNVAVQAGAIAALADQLNAGDVRAAPHRIGRLTDVVASSELPDSVGGLPVLGIANESLAAFPWLPDSCILVTGSVNSGRTETVAAMVQSYQRAYPQAKTIRFAAGKSRLDEYADFTESYGTAALSSTAAQSLADRLNASGADPGDLLVVIEGAYELEMSQANEPLQALVRACNDLEIPVLADGESDSLSIYGSLLQLIAAPRHGVAVQPDSLEGDKFFRTPFPPIGSREYPANRALYVRKGVVTKVQTAVPG